MTYRDRLGDIGTFPKRNQTVASFYFILLPTRFQHKQ